MDSQALRVGPASRSDESQYNPNVIHPRTVGNFIWTVMVLAAVGAAVYFLVPLVGKWMSTGMGGRDTMDRPSSMDVRDNLPNK